MAGIGFELKNLWGKRSYISGIRAYLVSAFATMGPTLLCIIMIVSMQSLLVYMGGSPRDKDFFTASMIYAFAFSLIITGGFVMFASRYVSDCIYEKKYDMIVPSFFGIIIVVLILVFFTGNLFFLKSPVEPSIKIISYIIFAELSVIWVQSVYLSTVKDYISVTLAFASGVLLILLSIFFTSKVFKVHPVTSVLFSAALGFLFMLVSLTVKLCRTFPAEKFTPSICLNYLRKITSYPQLFALGFFYYLGIYGHNFIFWICGQGILIADTYMFSILYDVPAFYALLTVIPSMVMFIVKVETSFYKKYKKYYQTIQNQGNIVDIKRAKEEMSSTLTDEMKHIFGVQFFISMASVIIGMKLLPLMGLAMLSVDIYCILCLGDMAYIFMYLMITILLYFNDRKGAMVITMIFCILSILLSYMSILTDASLYGYGFFFAAFISMMAAFARLHKYLENIEYYTFIQQSFSSRNKDDIFTRIHNRLARSEENKNA